MLKRAVDDGQLPSIVFDRLNALDELGNEIESPVGSLSNFETGFKDSETNRQLKKEDDS